VDKSATWLPLVKACWTNLIDNRVPQSLKENKREMPLTKKKINITFLTSFGVRARPLSSKYSSFMSGLYSCLFFDDPLLYLRKEKEIVVQHLISLYNINTCLSRVSTQVVRIKKFIE